MGIHTFFTSLNDLERIVRCPGRYKFEEHNVAKTFLESQSICNVLWNY